MNKIEEEVQRMLDVLGVNLHTNSHRMWDTQNRELAACAVGTSTVLREGMIQVRTIAKQTEVPGFFMERWSTRSPMQEDTNEPLETLGEFHTLESAVAVAIGFAMSEAVQEAYAEEAAREEEDLYEDAG